MEIEKINTNDNIDATAIRVGSMSESIQLKGKYFCQCFDKNGDLKWEDVIDNVVTDVGANQILDSAFGAGPVAGPFLGLISSVGYTGVPIVGNTMASHSTWVEAGNGSNYPIWSTPAASARASVTFASASGRSKALTAPIEFTISTAGTIKGAFLVFGTGAVATNNSTAGILYSAGLLSSGDKIMGIGDIFRISYSASA